MDDVIGPTIRSWMALSVELLGQQREEIDRLNVFPVPDGDTGTNLYLTLEAAADAPARRLALDELSYLLNDNVEVITSPPQPEA